MEERFIDTEEEKEILLKIKNLQYKGDIQSYMIKREASNYGVCLSRIAWREALHSGFNVIPHLIPSERVHTPSLATCPNRMASAVTRLGGKSKCCM
jgi:hypothetical protein